MQAYVARSIVRLLVLLAFGGLLVQAVPVKKQQQVARAVSYRLPNNTYPITYDVQLTTAVDKGDFSFTGEVLIVLHANYETDNIVVQARQLEIISVNLTSAYLNPELYDTTYAYDAETEFLTVTPSKPLKYDNYRLHIKFRGTLRTDNGGFYLSTYTDEAGNTKNIATTQFESTDARHAFPCYDEPAKKAVFRITITHGTAYSAVSNMPVINKVDNTDGTSTTSFQQTTLMSTYLLAFIISDFKYTEQIGRVPHRIYSRSGTENTQRFALETSVKTMEAIEDYLGVSYKLPKMDNAAVPDFAAGAMENWGLVTYREEYLLFSDTASTTGTQNGIATVIAHEFGHMWFGNLVSPYWWTFLWLNEGFASILTYIGADAVYPEWDLWQDFHVSDFQRALLADGRVNARPMTHYIEEPKDISQVFDSVVYSKAASVLIMWRNAMTDTTFKKALNDYLNKMEYDSAQEDDLFASFDKYIKEDNIFGTTVDTYRMFKSWTNQGGYPLITITRNYEKGTFEIKQEPFDGSNGAPSTDKRTWWVPYNYATASDPHYKVTTMQGYLNVGEEKKEVSQSTESTWAKDDWLVLNKRATGYYRVNYDDTNWKLITAGLISNPLQFHVNNRAQLLDDAFRLALAKREKFSRFLDLSVYLKNETEYGPWATANSVFTTLNRYLNGDKDYGVFQFYVSALVENFYEEVGVTENANDGHLLKMLRSVAINWACRSNYGDCLKITNDRLLRYVQGISIEPNLRTSILCNGLTKAGETEYKFVLNAVMSSNDQAFRRQTMSSVLGCVQNKQLIDNYLSTSITFDNSVNYREQERSYVVPGVVDKGPIQLSATIDFLITNHAKYNALGSDWSQNNPLNSALQSIANAIVNKSQQDQFEKLLDAVRSYPDIKDEDLNRFRATVKANLDWIGEYRGDIVTWLKDFKDGGAGTIVASTSALVIAVFVSLRSWF